MVKTRGQTNSLAIKENKSKDELGDAQILCSVGHATKSRNRITKKKTNKNGKKMASISSKIKLEEETDDETLLQAISNSGNKNTVTEEKNQATHKIHKKGQHDHNSSFKTSNNSYDLVRKYYITFLKNPDGKIVVFAERNKAFTQQKINTLVECIFDKQLTIQKASLKAKMPMLIGYVYYNEYCKDPNHNIPIPHHLRPKFAKFIGYIVDDNINLANATSKAGIHVVTSRRYYRKYKNDPNHELPIPKKRGLFGARCSQEYVNLLRKIRWAR